MKFQVMGRRATVDPEAHPRPRVLTMVVDMLQHNSGKTPFTDDYSKAIVLSWGLQAVVEDNILATDADCKMTPKQRRLRDRWVEEWTSRLMRHRISPFHVCYCHRFPNPHSPQYPGCKNVAPEPVGWFKGNILAHPNKPREQGPEEQGPKGELTTLKNPFKRRLLNLFSRKGRKREYTPVKEEKEEGTRKRKSKLKYLKEWVSSPSGLSSSESDSDDEHN